MRYFALVIVFLYPFAGMDCVAQMAGSNHFFPTHSFASDSHSDKSAASYYAHELNLLQEQSFMDPSEKASEESYRFLWLRSFHQPIVVRFNVSPNGTGIVVVKVADGAAGFPRRDQKIIQNSSRTLTQEQTQTFLSLVKRLEFWSVPSYTKNDQTGTDGSEWVIEAVRNGKYHVVARWSPDSTNPSKRAVRELGLALLSTSVS